MITTKYDDKVMKEFTDWHESTEKSNSKLEVGKTC